MKQLRFFILSFIITTLFFSACKKEEPPLPVVSTEEVTVITALTARSGGTIISDGGIIIIDRGVCWSIDPDPKVTDSKTSDGSGTGSFTSELIGLSANTSYYIRAYAINQNGTAYGEAYSFTTLEGLGGLITTLEVTEINTATAQSGGNIINDGGYPITARGIVWDTIPNPTLEQNLGFTSDGVGMGEFRSTIEGLYPGKKYYLRAYATNNTGTSYGNVRSFINLDILDYFIDSRDGTMYQTVKIGNQVWMAENLAYLPSVSPPSLGSRTTPYYYVYDYEGTNVTEAKATSHYQTYGVLYNWHAAINSCPEGWHLPTEEDWRELENYVSANPDYFEADMSGNRIAKALAFNTGWALSSYPGAVGNPYYYIRDIQNVTGFSVLPGGYRETHFKIFIQLGFFCYFWSATEYDIMAANRVLSFDQNVIGKLAGYKHYGYSVRCIKNY